MPQPTSSKQIWPIPAWILALGALILILLFIACYILFWPRHRNVPLAGPTPRSEHTARLSPPSTFRPATPSKQSTPMAETPSQPIVPPPPFEITIPAATAITVRTRTLIDSDEDAVGSRFPGTIVSPIAADGRTAVPQGSAVVLRLADKKKTGFFHRSLQLEIALAGVSVNGRIYPTQAGVLSMKAGRNNSNGSNANDSSPTPKGKKALVVLPNTELTFTLTAPFTIMTPSATGSN